MTHAPVAAGYAAVRNGLRDVVATTTPDGNLSVHAASILAAMDRIANEPL